MLKILSDDELEGQPPVQADGGPTDANFTLTEKAAKQVQKLLAQEKTTKAVEALRVGVRGGGCSGLQYFMEFAGPPESSDHVLTQHGVTFYIDRKSARYLYGGELDFHSSIQSSGFKWKNPNEKKSCGCGESFGV
jgi:iron-sulfur cluster assembly protein